jgi:hydroxylamine dehydrogenase
MTQLDSPGKQQSLLRSSRVFVIGLVVTLVVIGLVFIAVVVGRSVVSGPVEPANALAQSDDPCVTCHRQTTPGIVEQFGHSTMAAANITCQNCHEVNADYPGVAAHEGTYVLGSPTPAMCERCHGPEVAQYYQSRHSLPAYVAVKGTTDLTPHFMAMYQAIPEGSYAPDKSRNALYALEGPDITRMACETCHNIGEPQPDGSVGQCQKCHLRHEFSLEQARKPETCNNCHIGPDHPQWEIYHESPHGIAYSTSGSTWHWDAEPGTLTVNDFPAPTCATCHMAGFGASGTTHDVGDRLTWFLFSPISERRPNWQGNLVQMQNVCRECHNKDFIASFYDNADKATEAVNAFVKQSDDIMAPLKAQGLVTDAQFDEPIDFTYFEVWHHWGRTAKFGAWMQGPDYTQWHGAYEILHALSELRQQADEKVKQAQPGN